MLSAIIMLLIPLLADIGDARGFWSVFGLMIFFSAVQGINTSSIFTLAGGLPPKYMGALMLGGGIGGIGATIARALSLYIFPVAKSADNEFKGAMAYFILACIINICCGMAQFALMNNDFAIFHLWKNPGFKP